MPRAKRAWPASLMEHSVRYPARASADYVGWRMSIRHKLERVTKPTRRQLRAIQCGAVPSAVLVLEPLSELIAACARTPPRPNGGPPRVSDRACLTGMLFVLRSAIASQMLVRLSPSMLDSSLASRSLGVHRAAARTLVGDELPGDEVRSQLSSPERPSRCTICPVSGSRIGSQLIGRTN
jgi:hypothetical protein